MSANEQRLARLRDRLAKIDEAIDAVLSGQSYKLGSRSVTRADLAELRSYQHETETEIRRLEEGGTSRRRFRRVVPVG